MRSRHQWVRVLWATVVGLAVSFAIWGGLRLLADQWSPAEKQVAFKGALIAAAVVGWSITRRPFREMGWRRSVQAPGLGRLYLLGVLAMGLASVAMILLDLRHPLATQLRFWQVVVLIWGLSSVSEEIYVRGLAQSLMRVPGEDDSRVPTTEIAASAAIFGAMHVPLIWSGAGPTGGLIIVAATLLVGWAAAKARQSTGSLLHPILIHIAANVAAVPFSIVGVVIYRIAHGHLPDFVK